MGLCYVLLLIIFFSFHSVRTISTCFLSLYGCFCWLPQLFARKAICEVFGINGTPVHLLFQNQSVQISTKLKNMYSYTVCTLISLLCKVKDSQNNNEEHCSCNIVYNAPPTNSSHTKIVRKCNIKNAEEIQNR